MYLTQNIQDGVKTISLPFPLDNMDGCKEIAVCELYVDNITSYNVTAPLTLSTGEGKAGKPLPRGVYKSSELKAFLPADFNISTLNEDPRVLKKDNLASTEKINIHIAELDNTQNLMNEGLSDIIRTYPIDSYEDNVMYIEHKNPYYKKLKKGVISSLTINFSDQNGKTINNEYGITVVFHIQ